MLRICRKLPVLKRSTPSVDMAPGLARATIGSDGEALQKMRKVFTEKLKDTFKPVTGQKGFFKLL